MKSVVYEWYLGDILSNYGKINLNIEARPNKGTGYVNQIACLLRETSFGFYHFNMAMLFRTSILINGMLQGVPKLALRFLFANFSGSKASRNKILGTRRELVPSSFQKCTRS